MCPKKGQNKLDNFPLHAAALFILALAVLFPFYTVINGFLGAFTTSFGESLILSQVNYYISCSFCNLSHQSVVYLKRASQHSTL